MASNIILYLLLLSTIMSFGTHDLIPVNIYDWNPIDYCHWTAPAIAVMYVRINTLEIQRFLYPNICVQCPDVFLEVQHKKARLIYGKVNVSLSWCGHQHPPIRQPASGAGTPSSRHNLGRVMTNEATQLSKIISYVPDILKWHLSTYNNFFCWRYNNLK